MACGHHQQSAALVLAQIHKRSNCVGPSNERAGQRSCEVTTECAVLLSYGDCQVRNRLGLTWPDIHRRKSVAILHPASQAAETLGET
jgi:hypothetical protein